MNWYALAACLGEQIWPVHSMVQLAVSYVSMVHLMFSNNDNTLLAGDLDGVDSRLPETTEIALQYLGQCVLSIAVIVFVFPYFIVPLFPIAAMFLYTARCAAHNWGLCLRI